MEVEALNWNSGVLIVGGLNLVIQFDVGAEFERVVALHLAEVVLISVNRVEVLIGTRVVPSERL